MYNIARRIARLDALATHLAKAYARARAHTPADTARMRVLFARFSRVDDLLREAIADYDRSLTEENPEPVEPEPEPVEPRKHADGVGFTPFAWKHLLHDTGFAKDHTPRPYILGATTPKRVRVETRATLTLAFHYYTGRADITHMWVQWSDGKRHLVHRKGC